MGEWPTNTDSQDKGSIPDSDQGFGEEENKRVVAVLKIDFVVCP